MDKEFILSALEALIQLQAEKIEALELENSRSETERDRLQRRIDDLEARTKRENA